MAIDNVDTTHDATPELEAPPATNNYLVNGDAPLPGAFPNGQVLVSP
jgi:hypothetical protein